MRMRPWTLLVWLLASCAEGRALPSSSAARRAPGPHEFSADVVIWGNVCPDDCAPYLAYRLDREGLVAHTTIIGPENAVRYDFDHEVGGALGDETRRSAAEYAKVRWALDAVPVMIRDLPNRELGTPRFYVTDGTFMEVRSSGLRWKAVIWDNEVPSEAKPLEDFADRLHASLKRDDD